MDNLVELVMEARRGNINPLIKELRPMLWCIAHEYSKRRQDDLLQEAILSVWGEIDKVDTSRPETIKAYFRRCAKNKVIDLLRKRGRLKSREKLFIDVSETMDVEDLTRSEKDSELNNKFLEMFSPYLEYIRENGTTHGMHAHIAKLKGISISTATQYFHKMAYEYKKEFPDGTVQKSKKILSGL